MFLDAQLRPKLRQIERCVDDYRRGVLDHVDIAARDARRLFPILVTLDAYPTHRALTPLYDACQRGLSYASGSRLADGIRRVRFVTVEEIEMLVGPLAAGKADLVEVLQSWSLADPMCEMSLKNYLLLERGFPELPAAGLRGQFDEVSAEIRRLANELFAFDEPTVARDGATEEA